MEKTINKRLYLSTETQNQFNYLSNQNFEKTEPLQIHIVEKGIVIPYDSSRTPPSGGVLCNAEIDSFSLTAFNDPLFHEYSIVTGNISDNIQDVEYKDEEIIYIGDVYPFYGHFLTNSLTRLWILFNPKYTNYKVCFIGPKDYYEFDDFIDAFYLFGIKKENLIFIDKPTMFSKVIVPEPSYRYWDYWHKDYKRTIDQLRINSKKKYHYSKIYLSRSSYFGASGTFGEEPIERIFKKLGYKIIHPEDYSITEKLAIFSNCKFLAGLSGSAMHNILFCNDNITCYILNRSPCIMPFQIQIDQMKSINSYYIDAFLDILPTLDFGFPYLVGLNKKLELFFYNNNIKFSKKTFFKYLPDSLYSFMTNWNQQVIKSNFSYHIMKQYSTTANLIDIAKNANLALSNYSQKKHSTLNINFWNIFILPITKVIPNNIKTIIKSLIKLK